MTTATIKNGVDLTQLTETIAPREKLEELCEYVQATSPVTDIIRNPVPVDIELVS